MGVAREESDYLSEQFIQWFLKEQVEEVSRMSSLLAVVQRSGDAPMFIEDYLAREHRSPRRPIRPRHRRRAARSERRRSTCSSPRRIVTLSESRCSSSA